MLQFIPLPKYGRKSLEYGGQVPQNLQWETLMQLFVPPDFVMS